MNKILKFFGAFAVCCGVMPAFAVSAGTVNAANGANNARGLALYNTSTEGARGYQGQANAYKANQRNTYYMVTQQSVDTACREKIYACLTEYCGDVTVVPGQRSSKCQYATESELYNYTMLCLQKDTSVLMAQYDTNLRHS
ncbi:MAG: hypothetical protein II219_03115, partial [Alphaproteobacteria bacterium]|nr:hypothetical protein [Alphaproteobacteria bacterium]